MTWIATKKTAEGRFHLDRFGVSTAGVDAELPFELRVLDTNGRILVSVLNVFASDIRVSGKGKGGVGIGRHFASDSYHITDIVELRDGRIRSQFGDLDRKIQAAASDTPALEAEVVESVAPSQTVFSGTLLEYLNRFQNYQIKTSQMIAWQAKVNEWHRSKSPPWLIVRYGIRGWKVCANVHDVQELGANVLTTDNEATVSFYEHCRNTPAPEIFDLLTMLREGSICSGTIKGCDDNDKTLVRQRLRQHGLRPSMASRRYKFLKYSHIAGAKAAEFSQSVAASPEKSLIASAARCISPCNVLLTHTPTGNFSVQHHHSLGETSIHDFGEREDLLKYFLAWIGVAAAKVEGAAVFHEFCRIADVFHSVGLDDFGTRDPSGLAESLQHILGEAATVLLTITQVGR